jgi:hypothetical protein
MQMSCVQQCKHAVALLPHGYARTDYQEMISKADRMVGWAQTHTYDDLAAFPDCRTLRFATGLDRANRNLLMCFKGRYSLVDAAHYLYPPLQTDEIGRIVLVKGSCCPSCFSKADEAACAGRLNRIPCPTCGYTLTDIYIEFHDRPRYTTLLDAVITSSP